MKLLSVIPLEVGLPVVWVCRGSWVGVHELVTGISVEKVFIAWQPVAYI